MATCFVSNDGTQTHGINNLDQYTKKVLTFHNAFGLDDQTSGYPVVPSGDVGLLRVSCLTEEVSELGLAIGNKDRAAIIDALVDIQYFLSGTVLACGMADVFEEAFRRVHQTNMDKLDKNGKPVRDTNGRVVKPMDWQPPVFSDLV